MSQEMLPMDARETGTELDPKFDRDGLITAVVTHAETGDVLMLAHMNAEALALTGDTHIAHFWSRSRDTLWKKGETSGHTLLVVEARIDCDQDAVWLKCLPAGPACHTGAASCFYRKIEGSTLAPD
jgi:phosphoribosyl-AMP cyclohydrolase